jgi:hypothetical protein
MRKFWYDGNEFGNYTIFKEDRDLAFIQVFASEDITKEIVNILNENAQRLQGE